MLWRAGGGYDAARIELFATEPVRGEDGRPLVYVREYPQYGKSYPRTAHPSDHFGIRLQLRRRQSGGGGGGAASKRVREPSPGAGAKRAAIL